jgi:hypothetical protein
MQPHGGRPNEQDRFRILERRKRVCAAWVRGRAVWEIARDESVHYSRISRDIAWCHAQYLATIRGEVEKKLLAEIVKIDAVEREAWEAWERSKQDAQMRQARTIRRPAGTDRDGRPIFEEQTDATRREEGQYGDTSYLNTILACSDRRCKLFGLLVSKHEHTGAGGEPLAAAQVHIFIPDNERGDGAHVTPSATGNTGGPGPAT